MPGDIVMVQLVPELMTKVVTRIGDGVTPVGRVIGAPVLPAAVEFQKIDQEIESCW